MSLVVLLALALAAHVAACSTEPRSVPCSNGGDCEAADPRFGFCARGHCVECVGPGSCDGNPCVDGRCEIPCADARTCGDGRKCVDRRCVYPDWI
jgi:hypothetical protein